MMKSKIALVALTLCLVSPAFAIRESGGRRAPMAVKVEFTSAGSGIDTVLKENIMTLVAMSLESRKVKTVEETFWGREGESTLCVEFNEPQDVYEFDLYIQKLKEASLGLTSHQRILSCQQTAIAPNE